MSDAFAQTPPSASLNRVRIVDLPGLPLEPEVRNRRGDELLSNRALLAYAAEYAEELGLPGEHLARMPARLTKGDVRLRLEVPQQVDAALSSTDPGAHRAAKAIARRLGRNLAWLLITLHRGDAANRAVRPDWCAEDWARWQRVEQVWIGGGLVSGRLGALIVDEAQRLLATMGYKAIRVTLSPYRSLLPLIGAARAVPIARIAGKKSLLLGCDFGHTSVKRAILTYEAGALAAVRLLPAQPVDWLDILPERATSGRRVLTFMVETMAGALDGEPGLGPAALAVIAAYQQQGRLVGNGPYATIHAVGEDTANALLSKAISDRLGGSVAVHTIHDGTAAALAHAGGPHQAVIVMGTALGVGFPPAEETGLRPVSPTFTTVPAYRYGQGACGDSCQTAPQRAPRPARPAH